MILFMRFKTNYLYTNYLIDQKKLLFFNHNLFFLQYLSQVPTRAAEKTLVISCEEDKVFWKPALKAGVPIVSAEFVLTGILKQEVNIEQYLI